MVKLNPPRGTIYDARGRKLAVSVQAKSVFVRPPEVDDPEETAKRLAHLLEVDSDRLLRELAGDRPFVWVARKVEPRQAAAVEAIDLPGVGLFEESRRYYPFGELAAHVLGFVGTDDEGLGGLEAHYENVVSGVPVPRSVLLDARRARVIEPAAIDELATPGADLHLTLDATLQYLAEKELQAVVKEYRAKAGTIVILDVRDSAVLAMASVPTFDPNRFTESSETSRRNRAVMDAYEPGSTFKMVTADAAIDSLAVHPDDRFDCEQGGISIGRGAFVRDHDRFEVMTFRDIIALSSNVGAIKVAAATGAEPLYRATVAFGFGRRSRVDLPGESAGIVRAQSRWMGSTVAYAAFGHGLSVTPLQLANAFAALANGGWLHTPYVVRALGKNGQVGPVERPSPTAVGLAPATIQTVVRLLEGVVEKGTGTSASIEGYRVAGKTGTAEKSDHTGYSESGRVASFVGIAPSRKPRVVCLVAIDEPTGVTAGGQIAAPVFARVVSDALHYLGVPPAPEDWEQRTDFLTVPRLPRPLTRVAEQRRERTVVALGGGAL